MLGKSVWTSMVFGLSLALSPLGALQTGDAAETLSVDWLEGRSVPLLLNRADKKQPLEKDLRVIVFFGTYTPLSQQMMPTLMEMQKRYRDQGLLIGAVSPEPAEKVEPFLKAFPNVNFSVGVDRDGEGTVKYLGPRPILPKVFIVDNCDEILWDGEVEELPDVLESIFDQTYSRDTQKKIAPLLLELDPALRTGRLGEIENLTDRILKEAPGNGQALRARLFSYESNGQVEAGWEFLTARRNEFPKERKLYFMQLDMALRYRQFSGDLVPVVRSFLLNFPDRSGEINSIAWTLLNGGDFNSDAISAARLCIEALKPLLDRSDIDALTATRILTSQALYQYRIGNVPLALELQKQAADRGVDTSEAEAVNRFAAFYQAIEDLRQ